MPYISRRQSFSLQLFFLRLRVIEYLNPSLHTRQQTLKKMATPTITLKPFGQKIAQVGFGLWKVSSAVSKTPSTVLTIIVQVPNDSTADVVYKAIENGYRHFDGACDYGMFPNTHAEPDVG
jgi:hypothetical protein